MAAVNEYWAGIRVLAIDEDRVCLKILEATMRRYNYDVTPVVDAMTALRALGKARDPFDLVISEVHVPGSDGFKLLRHIAVEMGIPVIVLSANEDTETVKKVLSFGACRYLAKPVCAEQLKNIWQHVLRRSNEARNHKSRGNADADQRVQSGIAEAEQGVKSTRKNSRRKRNDGDGSSENEENSGKKPRMRWTRELHGKFVEAINRLGTDKVVPTRIFNMMDVDYISIQSIGSHLQKYRAHLKKHSDPKARAAERWTSSYNNNMSNPESFGYYHEHQIWPAESSNNPFIAQSIELRNNLDKRTLEDVLPPLPGANRKSKASAKALAGILLETNQGKASSHLDYYFENIPDEEMLEPVNQFSVQPPQLASHSSVLMNAPAFFQKENVPATNLVGALGDTSKFPYLVGNYNNSFWQAMVLSKFPDILHKDGLSLGSSKAKANIPNINQLASFVGTSSGQIQMVLNEPQNPMTTFIGNTTPVAGFNQQMAPFNIASSISPTEMLNGNFAPGSTSSMSLPSLQTCNSVTPTQMVNDLSNSSTLPNIEADSFVVPTQMLNGGDVVDVLPVQEGTVDQQALDGQLNDNNEFFMDDIFSMLDQQNPIEDDDLLKNFTEDDALLKNFTEDDALLKNFIEEDAFLNGDWF